MSQNLSKPQGLYDPQWEHDACGIGAVVNLSGRREHLIVEHGKQVLLNLQHRGAAGADESTGDGAGMLMQIPHEFLVGQAGALGVTLPEREQYGLAMVFLPQDKAVRRRCEEVLTEAIVEGALKVLGWRDVPTDNACLGEIARSAEPIVRQLFIDGGGLASEALERRLFVVRKRAEHRVRDRGIRYLRLAENIQMNRGWPDPVKRAVGSWLDSDRHREAILTPEYRETAVGVATAEDGTLYFTQLFILRRDGRTP